MADGKTHELHGLLAGGALLVLALALARAEPAYIASGLVLGTVLLSPDLDMARTRPSSWWGPLRVMWWPYAWAFDHRGVSHSWIVGPLTRLIYIGLPVGLVWWGCFQLEGVGPWLAWVAGGIVLGNWLHLLGDVSSSRRRRHRG